MGADGVGGGGMSVLSTRVVFFFGLGATYHQLCRRYNACLCMPHRHSPFEFSDM